jgi:hypothetical protein
MEYDAVNVVRWTQFSNEYIAFVFSLLPLQDNRRNLGRQTFSLLDSRVINRNCKKKKGKLTLTPKKVEAF